MIAKKCNNPHNRTEPTTHAIGSPLRLLFPGGLGKVSRCIILTHS